MNVFTLSAWNYAFDYLVPCMSQRLFAMLVNAVCGCCTQGAINWLASKGILSDYIETTLAQNNHLADVCRVQPESIINCARDVFAAGERHLWCEPRQDYCQKGKSLAYFYWLDVLETSLRRLFCFMSSHFPLYGTVFCRALFFCFLLVIPRFIVRRLNAQIEKQKVFTTPTTLGWFCQKFHHCGLLTLFFPSTSSNRITV